MKGPTPLTLKTELLCKGLVLGGNYTRQLSERGEEFFRGRKGGAGPAGGRYFLITNEAFPGRHRSLVNVPFTPEVTRDSDLVLDREKADRTVVVTKAGEEYAELELVPRGDIGGVELSGGVRFSQVAAIHGVDCLATTLDQECVYWARGERCKFCAIELSWKKGSVLKEKSPELLAGAIKEAQSRGACTHVTLTSGTGGSADKGLSYYLETLESLKLLGVGVPLHLQYEPLQDPVLERNHLERLKAAGCVSVGVHLEAWDDSVRRELCPGKGQIPRDEYFESWEIAVDVFGKSQVHTYLLLGVGEDPDDLWDPVTEICEAGVIPFIVPVRDVPGAGFKPEGLAKSWERILGLVRHAGVKLHETGLDPFKSKAGCVLCGGCSPIPEAFLETR
ncbi:MAG: radical SAM protein [Promethearchaeota archaeon]